MKFSCRIACVAFALLAGVSQAFAGASTAFQIDAAHDGRAKFAGKFRPPLTLKWSRDLGGDLSYPLIARGKVFVTVSDQVKGGVILTALNLKTGETVWHRAIAGSFTTTPAYDDGRVFVQNYLGAMQAFAADDKGKQLWAHQLTGQSFYFQPPTARKGMVYVTGTGEGGTLYAISGSNGNLVWGALNSGADVGTPAVAGDGVFTTHECVTKAFYNYNGHDKWWINGTCDDGGNNTTLVYNGRLYARDSETSYQIFDAAGGDVLGELAGDSTAAAFWRDKNGKDFALSVLNGKLVSTDLSSGQTAWTFTAGDGSIACPPIAINGYVAVGSEQGNLYLLSAASGQQLWTAGLGGGMQCKVGFSSPQTGMGAGQNTIVVPAGHQLSAFVAAK